MATAGREGPGALALVGAGEYTDAMLETDAALLGTVGGARGARVALLPTASGLEANGPKYWNDLGVSHFQKLGVSDIRPTRIIDHASANDPAQVELLRDVDFYYFSGGSPQHLIESMRGSAAWALIAEAQRARGAVMAGCSAGAMAMSGYTLPLRAVIAGVVTGAPGDWQEALAVVPGVVVFPHFDRIPRAVSDPMLRRLAHAAPASVAMVGVDEDTALVRLAASPTATQEWLTMGRQSVRVYRKGAEPVTLAAGGRITL